MGVRTDSRAGVGAAAVPPAFRAAVADLRAARLRPEVHCEEMPAPQRIAPFAAALAAEVSVDGDEVGSGRLILLHDPAGNDAWDGVFRCVAYARAEIEVDLVTDPMLAAVGWTWLTDALAGQDAAYHAASGTVTRVATENFGGMADDPGSAQLELRASWTPLPTSPGSPDSPRSPDPSGSGSAPTIQLGPHVQAWGELLCTAAGLPPVPRGVSVMPSRRGQRGPG